MLINHRVVINRLSKPARLAINACNLSAGVTRLFRSMGTQLQYVNQSDEGDKAYERALSVLNKVIKESRADLKPIAAQKIEELSRELSSLMRSSENNDNSSMAISSSDPLEKIKRGFQQFRTQYMNNQSLFKALADSQNPKVMLVACSDSRVDPALVLGLGLGEAFIVRNIASLVPPSKIGGHASVGSAIEYAVLYLKVEHIMIIGHSRCGGIKALLSMKEDQSNKFSEYIEDWMVIAQQASTSVKSKCSHDSPFEEQWASCVKESVNTSLQNCMTYKFVKEAIAQKQLSLHGAYYDFVNGDFEHWSHASN